MELKGIARQSWGLGILALLLFIAGNWQQTTIGFDSRFVMFAQEMLRHGPSIFPTTYGEPYADYSATSTLFTWLLSLPFGHVSSLTAWLPSALASAVIVGLMYRLVAPYSTRWALVSIALLLLTNTFISETRAVSLDQMLAAVSLAVFYLAYAHDHFGRSKPWPWLVLLLLLGFGIRGPIGLVIPTGMLCSYYLLRRQWRPLFGFGSLALILLVACVGLLLLLAKLSGGEVFLQDVIRMQFMGRMDGTEGASSTTYYFTSSMGNYALAYPLALLAIVAAFLTRREHQGPTWELFKYCAAAGLIVMIGLSVPQAKKARYILPMLPMAAILAAYPFYVVQGRVFKVLRTLIIGVWLALPAVLFILLLVARQRFTQPIPALGVILPLLAVLQVLALVMLSRARWRPLGPALCAVLAVWSSYILVVEPVQRSLYDTRTFTLDVREKMGTAPAPLVLHGMGKDAKAIKFMVNLDEDLIPLFTQSPVDLTQVPVPAWVVMSNAAFKGLTDSRLASLQPILVGRFDKDDYVLLHLVAPAIP